MSRPSREASRAMRTSVPHSAVRRDSAKPGRRVDGPFLHRSIDTDTSAEYSDHEGGEARHLVRQRAYTSLASFPGLHRYDNTGDLWTVYRNSGSSRQRRRRRAQKGHEGVGPELDGSIAAHLRSGM